MEDQFTNISFNKQNLDRYYIRKSIFNAINLSLNNFKGDLLDIGCGKMPYKKYISENSSITSYVGLDIETALEYDAGVRPDVTWDGIKMPFENETFDTAFGTEVLEHCPNPGIILSEISRVLKPESVFFFTVPFLWPLHEVPHDEFRYTPFSLKRLLTEAEFKDIEINATGGWHASLAQMLGLWIKRSPLSEKKRKILTVILQPIINRLIKTDKHTKVEFVESQMITGLWGIAVKK